MNQFLLRARAALKFAKITKSVLALMTAEWANRFLCTRGWRQFPLTNPLAVDIRTTERCFLKCRMCGQNGELGRFQGVKQQERSRVAPEVYDAIYEDIRTYRLKPFVKVTGGEALLEWDVLSPFMRKVADIGCVTKLNTNGVLLKNRELARDVVASGAHYVSISVDGDEATHTMIRGVKTAFRDSRQGVANLIEARRSLRSRYPMILLSCVVSSWNQDSFTAMSEVARDWGVDWLNIQFLNFLTPERSAAAHEFAVSQFGIEEQPWRGFECADIAHVDVNKVAEGIARIRREANVPVSTMKIGGLTPESIRRFHYTDEMIHSRICHMPFATAFIVPPGEATFCIDYPWYQYGDLRLAPLSEIWRSKRAQEFRSAMMRYYHETGRMLPQCMRCNWPYNT